MSHLPRTPTLTAIARRIVWFESPEKAVSDPARFFAYSMAHATHGDMKALRQHLSDGELRQLLERIPPGIVDARSWAYWHLKLDRYPPPPLPKRDFGARCD